LQILEGLVVELGGIHAAHGKHGVETFGTCLQAVGFLPEIIQDVLGDFADTVGVQQGLLVFRCTEFFLVLLAFNGLELWAHIVVVDLELQYLFIADGVGDYIGM